MHEGGLDQAARAMQEHQDEVDDPHVVGQPEEVEDAAAGVGEGKGVDDGTQHYKQDTGEACVRDKYINLFIFFYGSILVLYSFSKSS